MFQQERATAPLVMSVSDGKEVLNMISAISTANKLLIYSHNILFG